MIRWIVLWEQVGLGSSGRWLADSGDYGLLHSPLLVTPDLSSCLAYFTLTCPVSQKVIKLITAALLSVCPGLGRFTLSHPVSLLGHRAGEVALGTAWDLIYESWLYSRCHSLNYFTFLSLSSFAWGFVYLYGLFGKALLAKENSRNSFPKNFTERGYSTNCVFHIQSM